MPLTRHSSASPCRSSRLFHSRLVEPQSVEMMAAVNDEYTLAVRVPVDAADDSAFAYVELAEVDAVLILAEVCVLGQPVANKW